jgi:hypothetical protein
MENTYKSTTSYNIRDGKDNKHRGANIVAGIGLTILSFGTVYFGGNKEPKLAIRHTEGFPEGAKITHVYAPSINGTVLEVIKYNGEPIENNRLDNDEWSLSTLFRIKYLPKNAKDSTDTKTVEQHGRVIIKYDTINKKL